MESQVGFKSEGKLNGDVIVSCNGNGFEAEVSNVEKISCNGNGLGSEVSVEKETNYLEKELLEDLDSYLEDIADRLAISRMVNDSVIKGMVNAVEQDAAERIALKELEISCLKQVHELEGNKIGCTELLVKEDELTSTPSGRQLSYSDACAEHGEMRKSMRSLRIAANEQFGKLKKEIDGAKGRSSIKRIGSGSGSELLGLGGILVKKEGESWGCVDKTLTSLKETMDTMCERVDNILNLSNISLCERKQEEEFQGDIEAMVMQTTVRNLQEDFEEKLWDHNAKFSSILSVNWNEKFNEILSLRTELDAMVKLLSTPETGQLISHGSLDMDSSHVISSASLWQGNGKLEDFDMPENFDAAQLKHMSKEELVSYFNTIITKMRRDHESIVQKKTEQYFTLKREYLNLKERGPSLPHRKDFKEFDTIRKKIPEVITTLNKILVQNENLPALTNNAETVGDLKDRIDSLLSENRQLRDLLSDKKNELKCLSLQISDAEEKILQHSLTEANMLKLIANLNSTIEDVHIEASINELIHKCFLMEFSGQMRSNTEALGMEFLIAKEIYDIIFKEAVCSAESMNKCYVEDSDIETLIVQEICGFIFTEAMKDAEEKLRELYSRYVTENAKCISLEKKAFEKENRLWLIIEEKERLRQEVLTLEPLLQEKEKLADDLAASLEKEREQRVLLCEELNIVKEQSSQQQTLASEKSKELESIRHQLLDASQQIEENKLDICKLQRMLEAKTKELKKSDEQREVILAISQERQKNLLSAEAKEKELKKQMQAIVLNVHRMSKLLADFEVKVEGSIKTNALRVEDSCSQLRSLIKNANSLRRTELKYKEKLERKCDDLQIAEAEVDLLGDEVDTLLGLLEKIYIALDHYSPILKHYPGITEILQLVRRELSGESAKSR